MEFTYNDFNITLDDKLKVKNIKNYENEYNIIDKNLSNIFSRIYFISKIYKKYTNINLVYVIYNEKYYKHLSILKILFEEVNFYFYSVNDNINSDKLNIDLYENINLWKDKEFFYISDIDSNNVDLYLEKEKNVILELQPIEFCIDFIVNSKNFKYIRGILYRHIYLNSNNHINYLIGNCNNYGLIDYDYSHYKNNCNNFNYNIRNVNKYKNIISNTNDTFCELLSDDIESSIVVYILSFYIIHKQKINYNLVSSKYILNYISNTYINIFTNICKNIKQTNKYFIVSYKKYYIDDVIKEIKDNQYINCINHNDIDIIKKNIKNKELKDILSYYPLNKSKEYNENEFISNIKSTMNISKVITMIKEYNFTNIKLYNILDNCAVSKFIEYDKNINFLDRIFILIKINCNSPIIKLFFDKCLLLLDKER